jgi:hypothetical protein
MILPIIFTSVSLRCLGMNGVLNAVINGVINVVINVVIKSVQHSLTLA